MLAYHTPTDPAGQRWRIEVTDKIRVYRLTARGIAGRPGVMRDPKDLDEWLSEHGWTSADLKQVSRSLPAAGLA